MNTKLLSVMTILIILLSGCTSDVIDTSTELDTIMIEDNQEDASIEKTEKDEIIIENKEETLNVEAVYLDLAEPNGDDYFKYKSEIIKVEIKKEEEMLFDIISKLMTNPNDELFFTMFPDGVKLLGANIEDGILTVNLSRDNLYGSSSQELGIIEQITKTAENINELGHFEKIDSLMFLIDGEIEESMMGHMSINEPLPLLR